MNGNGTEPTGAPIKPVMLSVAGVEYPLRYTFRTLLALEDMGLTPDEFWRDVQRWAPRVDGEGAIVEPGRVKPFTVLKFIRACLPTTCPLTLDQLGEQISPLEFGALFTKACEVMAKTRPSAEPSPAPAANQEPEGLPVLQ